MSSISGGSGSVGQLYGASSTSSTQRRATVSEPSHTQTANPSAFAKKKDAFSSISDTNEVLKKSLGKPVSEKNADHASGFVKKATGSVDHDSKASLKEGISQGVKAEGKVSLGGGKTVGGSVGVALTHSGVEVTGKVKLEARDKDYTLAKATHKTESSHASEDGTFTAKTESKSGAKAVYGKAGSLEFSDEGVKASAKASAMGKVSSKATCSGSVCGVEVANAEAKASASVGAQAKAKAKFDSSGADVAVGAFVGAKMEGSCEASVGSVSVGAKGGLVVGAGAEASFSAKVKDGKVSIDLGATLAWGYGFTGGLKLEFALPKWLGGKD